MKVLNVLTTILFVAVFFLQFYNISHNYYSPSTTSTSKHHENLIDMEFPILLRICIRPGFIWEKLHQYGYESDFHFFLGLNKDNKSSFGNFGHFENGTFVSPSEILRNVGTVENIATVIAQIYIRDWKNRKLPIDLDELQLRCLLTAFYVIF